MGGERPFIDIAIYGQPNNSLEMRGGGAGKSRLEGSSAKADESKQGYNLGLQSKAAQPAR